MKKFIHVSLCVALLGTMVVKASGADDAWKKFSTTASTFDKNNFNFAPTDAAKGAAIAAGVIFANQVGGSNTEKAKAVGSHINNNKAAISTTIAATALLYSKWLEAGLRHVPYVGNWVADRICDNKECTGSCERCQFTKAALVGVLTFGANSLKNSLTKETED